MEPFILSMSLVLIGFLLGNIFHISTKRKPDGVILNHYRQILELLFTIKQKLEIMSTENKQALQDLIDKLKQSNTNIRGDIQRLKDSLPDSGGLTQAEVDELKTNLGAVAADADELDKENEPNEDTGSEGGQDNSGSGVTE